MATQYARLFDPTTQFQTKSGALNTAGLLRVYLDETDDLAEVFDDGMSIMRQPVVLDNNGRAPGLFVDSTKTYRLEVYDRNGSLMFTIRSMNSTGGGGSGGGNYYPGDIFIDIDQEMREISLKNLKRLRADGKTIVETETDEEVVFSVNPDIIGDDTKVKAGPNMSVTYDSDNNEYTVTGSYSGSNTVGITSDGEISGKYSGGYGINVNANGVISVDQNAVQKKLTAGEAILISSDGVVSNASPVKFSSAIGNPDLSPASANVMAQRNGSNQNYTMAMFTNAYGNTGTYVLIPHNLGEGYLYIADNYLSVKAPAIVSGTATNASWSNSIYQTPVALDWTFTLAAGKILDINVNACVYQAEQTSTPLYRMELVDASNNVKTYFSWVPREMDSTETDPDRSTLNGRLVWKNTTSSSVTLHLRVADYDQAPTGTTQLKSIRIDGLVN